MTQTRFETFNVPAMYMATQGDPGCPVCFGTHDDVSHTVPIYEDCALHHAILRVGGRDLTVSLMKNLTDRGYSFTASVEWESARDISEKLRNNGVDYDTDLKLTDKEKTCEFPDGNIITVGAERYHSAKVLFQPSTPLKESAESTSFISGRSVTMTSARFVRQCRCFGAQAFVF